MRNVNDHLKGRSIRTRSSLTMKRMLADFPGWDAPNCADFIQPIAPGTAGVITEVESHGSNPWTRFSVRFADGSRASGIDPKDVQVL